MEVSGLHHINIRTMDVDATQVFYEEIVGLHVGPRPNFAGAGIWLYAGDHPWVHISMADEAMDGKKVPDEGFAHIAFDMTGMKGMVDKLEDQSIKHILRPSPDRRPAQLFFHDPNGVELEFTCSLPDAEADGLEIPDRPRDR